MEYLASIGVADRVEGWRRQAVRIAGAQAEEASHA
jgi:hypothetical protein